MPNRVNALQVETYVKLFKDAGFIIAVGYPKLNVQGIDELRGRLAAIGGKMFFVRNRLADIAMRKLGYDGVKNICREQTAFVWGEDPVSVARFLVDFKKERQELLFHGALVEKSLLDSNQVVELSKSPTKQELKSIISGQILHLGGKLSAQVLSGGARVAGQIKKRSEAGDEAAA
ncbi:MAG: 50S ribosomal protein L10 [Planctomycetota bacterium]|nr:50S ribosomal protein L10 [Planctomycetota bacterium]